MPAYPRRAIVDESTIGVYHCISRCVRRAYLCGWDPVTGKNYDYRKQWVQDRLQYLAQCCSLEIAGFAVMGNHIHVIVRLRPDWAAQWSPEEIAQRIWWLHPGRCDDDGRPAVPTSTEIAAIMAEPNLVERWRGRLASLSCFMAWLNEYLARRANREDGITGRFFEGRFKSQALADDAAVLACSIYVDLNPIRADIAQTPEESRFTSVYERIQHQAETTTSARSVSSATAAPQANATRHDWLSPFVAETSTEESAAATPPQMPIIPLTFRQYLQLLDWTGREVRADKPGAIPAHLAPIFERLAVRSEGWLLAVKHFRHWFRLVVGRGATMMARAAKAQRAWLHGVRHCRLCFD